MKSPYREPAPIPPDPYGAAWSRLRQRRAALRAGTVAFFVFVVPGAAMAQVPAELRTTAIALGLTLAVPGGLFLLSLLPPFRCPGCQHRFFTSPGAEVGSSKACFHCGLVVGTRASPRAREGDVSLVEARPAPIFVALRGLAAAVLATVLGYQLVRDAPGLAIAVLAAGIAGSSTILVARWTRSQAFPRTLFIPMLALSLSSVLAIRADHLEQLARFKHARALAPKCP